MARGLNSMTLVGTLTQDPELKYTPQGLAILELNLGGDDHLLADDGVMRDLAWYHRVTVFGAQAETLANTLAAGDPVFIDGALNYRTWDDPSGQRKSALDFKALRVERLSLRTRQGAATSVDARGQHRLKNALNEARIIGNLTRDAELKHTPSGAAVTRFSVAVNEKYKDRGGQEQEKTHYVDVNVWRELAEGSAELAKGDAVFVVGRLVNDSWTDNDGVKRYATKIEGHRVEALDYGGRHQNAAAGNASAPDLTVPLDLDEEYPPDEELPF